MNSVAESWLLSYVRAWERHQIHFSLHGPLGIDVDQPPRLLASGEKGAQGAPRHPHAVALSGGPLTYRFSYAHHDRKKRGELNEHFLDPGMLRDVLLPAVETLAPEARLVTFSLAPVYATEGLPARVFLAKLDRFLAGLPAGYRYAVAIRNPEFLLPDYRLCLRSHGVAHLFHETGLPSLLDQIQIPGILTTGHVVYRDALEPGQGGGRSRDGHWELGMVETVRRCVAEKKTCYIYLEEHASVASLEMLMAMLNADLAKLSPIKKQAA